MRYSEIYDLEFLNRFQGVSEEIGNIQLLDNKYEIDVKKIADICGISIDNVPSEYSGWSINNPGDYGQKEIKVNVFEPEYRRRFTIAHEMGHIILGHRGVSYRSEDISVYGDTISRMNEIAANSFAADLLMPRILVERAILNVISELNLGQYFGADDFEKLIDRVAEKLNVSRQALKYRVENFGMFREGE